MSQARQIRFDGEERGPQIHFQSIRICDGSQRGGFEEMCFQLFSSEFLSIGEIIRVEGKGGDEGFEAICRRADGTIIGLQAKFFDKLGDVQWRQIEQSIQAARTAEQKLCEYIVCAPINLNPTQRKHWERIALKPFGLGNKKSKLKFRLTYWGASHLRRLLLEPKNRSRLWYWFGCTEFSLEQLRLCNDRARADLDCRYTPKHHTPTDAERVLRAFLFADEFISEFRQLAQEFAKLNAVCGIQNEI